MALTVLLLIGLAAVLGPSAGQQPIASVSTYRPDQQKVITDVHNDFRRYVKPSASNMLKMKWDPIAAGKARLWANQCTYQHSPVIQRTIAIIAISPSSKCYQHQQPDLFRPPSSAEERIKLWAPKLKQRGS
ncbi:cysteine-rich venom protein pseudechetoxin-like [Sphaerodactylus townsendi]|uniref:cysteine-rich venom protein pseudechetoxin-like n=1 Tax=Sphaerodactylus townsendi TaxID=933632 RepID=UPI002026F48E|nr:cysteine-rich venom protein pseudechetoxin-like [Sphaerodactylus townsendi]